MEITTSTQTALASLTVAFLVIGCGPTEEPIDAPPIEYGTDGYISGGTGSGAGSNSDSDSGSDSDGDGGRCLADPKEDQDGLIHQCQGYISARFSANGEDEWETIYFGNSHEDDPYELPKVLACCDEFDDSTIWTEQNHYKACWHGLARTFCRTIPGRIWAQATDDLPTSIANQIVKAGNYVASVPVQNWCIHEFFFQGGIAALPQGQSAGVFSHYFDLEMAPDYATASSDWPIIEDPFLEIADAEMTDIFIPATPSAQLVCESGQDNHEQVLVEGLEQPSIVVKTVVEGELDLQGPEFDGRPITGSGDLSDLRNSCGGLQCSKVGFKQDVAPSDWTVYQLGLHLEQAAAVEWGGSAVATVGRLAVRLMSPVVAQGNPTAANMFTVAAGDAAFFVTGQLTLPGGASPHILPARNATPITFTRHPTENNRWLMGDFDLTYTDSEDNEWIVTVTAPLWE